MIQPTLLARSSTPVLAAPPLAAGGDAAFGASFAALLDVASPPVQPVAAPGKPLPPVLPVASLTTFSPHPVTTVVSPAEIAVPEHGAMRTAHSHAIEPAPAPTTTLPTELAAAQPVSARQSPPVASLPPRPLATHAPIAPPRRDDASELRGPVAPVARALRTLREIQASASPGAIAVVLAEASASAAADTASAQPSTKVERDATRPTPKTAQTPVSSRRVPVAIAGPGPRIDGESSEPESPAAIAPTLFADALGPVIANPRPVASIPVESKPVLPETAQAPASLVEPAIFAAPAPPPAAQPLIQPATDPAESPPQPKRQQTDAPASAALVIRDGIPPAGVAPSGAEGKPAAPATAAYPAPLPVIADRIAAPHAIDHAPPVVSPGIALEAPVASATPPVDGIPAVALQPRWPIVQPATVISQSVAFDPPPPAETAPLDASSSALPMAAPATPGGTASPLSPVATPAGVTDGAIERPGLTVPDAPKPMERPALTRATSAPMPAPVTPAPAITPGATAPAFRLFAQALHAARRDEEVPAAALFAPVEQPRATLAVHTADGAALDMGDPRWPQAMVDRIEGLRDAVSAASDLASTSIRLTPAALGTIDVSVRTEGDTVHVHFNAEQAATRALLNDAQPRLAELAEARGVKLGQASVGAGADGHGQRQPAPQPIPFAAPPLALREDEPEITTTRIA